MDAALYVKSLAGIAPLSSWPDGYTARVIDTLTTIEHDRAVMRGQAG